MRKMIALAAALAIVLGSVGVAFATPDKAKGADKTCGDCHSHISHAPFGN